MRKSIILLFALSFIIIEGMAQSPSDTKVDYLKRKLTFNYTNPDQGVWWVNTLRFDEESNEFRFKTVSAKNPAKILGRKHTERAFRLEDLNPYLITVEDIDENSGYLVEGKLLRIETVKHKDLVRKFINTSSATPQSYIHFVIPAYLSDSSNAIADSLKTAFKELILEATSIYRSDDDQVNRVNILSALTGDFSSKDVKRFTSPHSDYVISFEEYQDRKRVKAGFIGHDSENSIYYELDIYESGKLMESHFRIDTTQKILTLQGISHPERSIVFENKSKIVYHYGDIEVIYRPARSF
ncbi:MAG: hypothetical protein ACJAZM_002297 [Cyclobacteriaceae bacterium]|jgi:hypothetical protein